MDKLKVLIIGAGGREHVLAWKIAQSPLAEKIFCAPGNAGIAKIAECVPIAVDDLSALLAFAKSESIGLTVVGPEVPLVEGLVDLFESEGLKVFGPCKKAARLEGSKIFSKECMRKFKIPTADFEIFEDYEKASAYVLKQDRPLVVKADGLAAGKGVVVAQSSIEAIDFLKKIFIENVFGEAGKKVLIEECLYGQELSVLALTDGTHVVPLASSQDHKRVGEGDIGPNTGGMGAYSPCPLVSEAELLDLVQKTVRPLVAGLAQEGIVYKGVVYAGLMLTDKGPFVLEYNVRFGDPEAQVVLPRLRQDLVQLILDILDGRLSEKPLDYCEETCITVVLAAEGYPGSYAKGHRLDFLENVHESHEFQIFHAGTMMDDAGKCVSSGGRVLNVTGMGKEIVDAQSKVYKTISQWPIEGLFYRKDIASKARQLRAKF